LEVLLVWQYAKRIWHGLHPEKRTSAKLVCALDDEGVSRLHMGKEEEHMSITAMKMALEALEKISKTEYLGKD
jgi:hypothetical protein